MKKLLSWLKPNVTRFDVVVASMVLLFLLSFGIISCNNIDWDNINLDDPAMVIILEETVDAFGYVLGALAAKDPDLRAKIKGYHDRVVAEGLTLAIANEALQMIIKSDELVYRMIARKISRLLVRFGVILDKDGVITDFGALSEKYLVIGKDAYLAALRDAGVAVK